MCFVRSWSCAASCFYIWIWASENNQTTKTDLSKTANNRFFIWSCVRVPETLKKGKDSIYFAVCRFVWLRSWRCALFGVWSFVWSLCVCLELSRTAKINIIKRFVCLPEVLRCMWFLYVWKAFLFAVVGIVQSTINKAFEASLWRCVWSFLVCVLAVCYIIFIMWHF